MRQLLLSRARCTGCLQEAHAAHWSIPVLQVPDTLLLESSVTPKAATVSSLLLSWILSNEQLGMKLYQVIRHTAPRLLLALLLASQLSRATT